MKTLFSIQGLMSSCGGSAISESSLFNQLVHHVDATALCPNDGFHADYAKSLGIENVILYNKPDFFYAFQSKHHWLHGLFEGVGLVHLNGHWRWEDFFWAKLCVQKKIPYIVHPRGMYLVGHRRKQSKRIYNAVFGDFIVRNAAKVIALSNFEVSQFAPYAIDRKCIEVIPNGVTIDDVGGAVDATLQAWVGERHPYFLYLGRLESRKNLLFLLEAFKAYRSGGGTFRLAFVGPSERSYDQILRKKIEALSLQEEVSIRGAVHGRSKWYLLESAAALIYPTVDEPYGRVPFEAIKVATPPIVPTESGSSEYLKPFFSDLIYSSDNLGSLTQTLHRAASFENLGGHPEIENARQWVNTRLDWSRVTEEVLSLYETLDIPPSARVSTPHEHAS